MTCPLDEPQEVPPIPARILLVVTNANFAATLRRILGRCGYAVDTAGSGEEALGCIEARRYDAIISDVHLPGAVCGLTLLQRMRMAGREAPIIFLTEEETARVRTALESCAGVHCLRLPLDVDRLKQLVAASCRG